MELVWAITNIFMHVLQNNLAKLFILNICFGKLKVKATFASQMLKWSKVELVWAITSTFIHGSKKCGTVVHLKHLFR